MQIIHDKPNPDSSRRAVFKYNGSSMHGLNTDENDCGAQPTHSHGLSGITSRSQMSAKVLNLDSNYIPNKSHDAYVGNEI